MEKKSNAYLSNCKKQVASSTKTCAVGGCGMAYSQCYQGTENMILEATQKLKDKIKKPLCISENKRMMEAIDHFKADLASDTNFESTWSGLEIMLHVEVMRYKSVASLVADCKN